MLRAKTTEMKRGGHLSPFGDETITPTPTEGSLGEEVRIVGGGGGGLDPFLRWALDSAGVWVPRINVHLLY